MNLLPVALLGLAALACLLALARRQNTDLGQMDHWTAQQARDATIATEAYLGRPYEYARRAAPDALTTREQRRAADAVIRAEREERAREMDRRRFRRVG